MRGLALLALAVLAQTPTFRMGVERVLLDVSATRDGRSVAGLTAADFSVTDNGVAQQIESAQLEDAALSVQLVLDVSSSLQGSRLQRLIDASTGLLSSLRPTDRAGLITFATSVEVRVPLTSDIERVKRAVAAVRGTGATSLRDAVALALETRPAEGTRGLIVVFSDGADTTSWLRSTDIVESARRSGTVIHLVEIRGPDGTSPFLSALAKAAGGRIFSASSEKDLAQVFSEALSEMRARYLLTFAPNPADVAGWHDLKVRTRANGIDVQARPGYFATPSK
jgi:Ca-activated chloride channel family protein